VLSNGLVGIRVKTGVQLTVDKRGDTFETCRDLAKGVGTPTALIADVNFSVQSESNFVMPTILQSIQTLFNDHQTRLAAVSAAPGVVGLSLELDQMSATYLSKAVQILVRPKYAADSNTGTSPEDKISSLASSVSRLSKQVRPLAPNDAFYSAFTSGSVAAAQDVFLSIFGLTMP
jgi:hypothetical protein